MNNLDYKIESMNRFLIILFLFILTGCGNVLDKNINVDNCAPDLKEIRNNNELYTKRDLDQCYILINLCKVDGIKDMRTTYRKLLDTIKGNRIRFGSKGQAIKKH